MVLDGVHELDHVVDGQGADAVAQVLHGQDFAGLGVIVPGEGGQAAVGTAAVGVAVEQDAHDVVVRPQGLAGQLKGVRGERFLLAATFQELLIVGLGVFLLFVGVFVEVRYDLFQILLDGLLGVRSLRIDNIVGSALRDQYFRTVLCRQRTSAPAAGVEGRVSGGRRLHGGVGRGAGGGGGLASTAGGQGEGHDHGKTEGEQSFHHHNLISA